MDHSLLPSHISIVFELGQLSRATHIALPHGLPDIPSNAALLVMPEADRADLDEDEAERHRHHL